MCVCVEWVEREGERTFYPSACFVSFFFLFHTTFVRGTSNASSRVRDTSPLVPQPHSHILLPIIDTRNQASIDKDFVLRKEAGIKLKEKNCVINLVKFDWQYDAFIFQKVSPIHKSKLTHWGKIISRAMIKWSRKKKTVSRVRRKHLIDEGAVKNK